MNRWSLCACRYTISSRFLVAVFILVSAAFLVASLGTAAASSAHDAIPRIAGEGQEIRWSGAGGDGAWSNPENWTGGRVPGPADTVRLSGFASATRVDAAFSGVIGGLTMDADYTGTLLLERTLWVQGNLEMAGGTLQGGKAGIDIGGAARVRGGVLVTPAGTAMNAVTLEIAAPGVVQMGPNGKLNLSGSGQPLQGDGLLDTTTYRPNSIEYTGADTADLMTAGPVAGLSANIPDAFSRIDALTLNTGETSLTSAVIDPANVAG